jgi:hypothetical protein
MAQLSNYAYPMPEWGDDWRQGYERQHNALVGLQQASDALSEGKIVGGLIRFQVADGYAYYRVVKASPLTVEWVPFGDNYQVHPAMIRGLNKADIVNMLNYDKRIASLFGGRK